MVLTRQTFCNPINCCKPSNENKQYNWLWLVQSKFKIRNQAFLEKKRNIEKKWQKLVEGTPVQEMKR
jgi:hypothetical protein